MSLRDQYDFDILVNEAENLVIEELERQLALPANREVCRSQDCVLDMAAYALNLVQPLYRANLLGRLYAQSLDQEHGTAIRRAVEQAIAKISANPPA